MSFISFHKILKSEAGWYKGDFHAHTNYSDGRLTPAELLTEARDEGLDFFSMTDHNNMWSHDKFENPDDMLIIPGVEVTMKYGHFNVFGLDGVEPTWMQSLPKTMEEYEAHMESGRAEYTPTQLMALTHSQGLYNSINHPLLVPWAWLDHHTDLRHVDFLEIWNDPSWPDNQTENPAAVAMWTRWLNAGHRITAIGGSDFHTPFPSETPDGQPVGRHHISEPTTHVYAESLSGVAVIEGLKKRHAYVSMGPSVEFSATAAGQSWMIGDDIGEYTGPIEFQAVAQGEGELIIQLVRNGTVVDQAEHENQVKLSCTETVSAGESAWFRLDIRTADQKFLAITNPIFCGPPMTITNFYYGEFLS